ncbi:MAG: hypothetical protein WA510_04140 [Acidobacteriaceae bacterium]
MATSAITSNLLSQIVSSQSTANQFVSDLNQLAQDLQTGNLPAAQQDYVTLSEDAQNGLTSSSATTSASGITTTLLSDIASSSSSSSTFVNELNQLGTDLQNGNLANAQQDLLGLDSTALNAASSTSTNSGATSSATSATATNQAQAGLLIQAIVQALGEGDSSAVSSGLSELASISPSSAGASALEQESAAFGSGASSSSGSINQLLQGLNSSSSSSSLLNLLA